MLSGQVPGAWRRGLHRAAPAGPRDPLPPAAAAAAPTASVPGPSRGQAGLDLDNMPREVPQRLPPCGLRVRRERPGGVVE